METANVFKIRASTLAWAIICGAIVLIGFGGLYENKNINSAPGSSIVAGGTWQDFSLSRLDAGLKQGHPVVVDFTAVWCINCHFVEAAVLNTQPVESAFRESNAVLLRANLDDPVVMAFLSKLGGRSIPFLAIFSPDNLYRPAVLQDIYSASAVIQDVRSARS